MVQLDSTTMNFPGETRAIHRLPHLRWKLLLRQASQQGIGATQQDLRWCRELDEFEGIETTAITNIYIYIYSVVYV